MPDVVLFILQSKNAALSDWSLTAAMKFPPVSSGLLNPISLQINPLPIAAEKKEGKQHVTQ